MTAGDGVDCAMGGGGCGALGIDGLCTVCVPSCAAIGVIILMAARIPSNKRSVAAPTKTHVSHGRLFAGGTIAVI